MTLTNQALDNLQEHWAVSSIADDDLRRAEEIVKERIAKSAVGKQIDFSFSHDTDDDKLLERLVLAFELAAIDGLQELSRPSEDNVALCNQAIAASHRAFEIRCLLPIPVEIHRRMLVLLKLSSMAYCGDRWSDLRRWYRENDGVLSSPSCARVPWDRRLLYRLFDCWVRLFRKNGWQDIDQIREIIAKLRDDQERYETSCFQDAPPEGNKALAIRLVALYHWARSTEVLAQYMLQGSPSNPLASVDKHFEAAIRAATASGDSQTEMILHWMYATARIMIKNSLWWATRGSSTRTNEFVKSLIRSNHRPMFELLSPQRSALLEQGLLDLAKTAIVIDLPTSGGKTLLAQFRILQALNQFHSENGWVAYVAPTRALCAQITRGLRTDFKHVGLRVEQLTAAVEVDSFEDSLLEQQENQFHILVATPEKLSLVIRNMKIPNRPLALVVMDEAHNLESEGRGLRIELFLATVKMDCPHTNFLLLMPYVEKPESVAAWLAHDVNAGHAISLGTVPWKPNERIIGLYRAVPNPSQHAGWHLCYETLTTTPKAMALSGTHRVGSVRPVDVPKSKVVIKGRQMGLGLQTVAMATTLSSRGTSIAIANQLRTVWTMAECAAKSLPSLNPVPQPIQLVQDFLRTEVGSSFKLIATLKKGVGVHHSGLSDEARALMEWLAETGELKVLCATTTVAQGINFPVSSIFLQTPNYPYGKKMSPREFWNLAGRAGRIGHDSVGVIGIAEGTKRDSVVEFVSRNTGALVSRLVSQLDELDKQGELAGLSDVLWQDQWEDFRCYVAHLWVEKKNLQAVLSDSEELLRQTFGYRSLRSDPTQHGKAEALLVATRNYAHSLATMRQGVPQLADATGFSPEGIKKAMNGLDRLGSKLTASDWTSGGLFGEGGRIADLYGVMLKVPQLKRHLDEIQGKGDRKKRIAEITCDWVNGKSIKDIASKYFMGEAMENDITPALSDACRAIYGKIVNTGTWGLAALSRLSDDDCDALSESEQRKIKMLPAMIYHGVRTEEAVLMRMNFAPRSVSENLGQLYRQTVGRSVGGDSLVQARDFLRELSDIEWQRVCPEGAILSGRGYRKVWNVLSGEMAP